MMIMRPFLVPILASLVVGCATKPDPIDRLVADYTATHGMWVNGEFPILGLPETASQEQVIKRALEMHDFSSDDVDSCKILKVRRIHIPPTNRNDRGLFAALVQVNTGQKIVLFRWAGIEWWSRICDAKSSS